MKTFAKVGILITLLLALLSFSYAAEMFFQNNVNGYGIRYMRNMTWINGSDLCTNDGKCLSDTATTTTNLTEVGTYFVNRTDWTTIDNYPTACSAGYYVQGIGDTLTCVNVVNDTDTTYTASGTLIDLTGTVFSINEGTLTDERICEYESTGTQIECTKTLDATGECTGNICGGGHTHPASQVTTGTFTGAYTFEGGDTKIDTDTGGDPFYIMRQSSASESAQMYVDDGRLIIITVQDENESSQYGAVNFVMGNKQLQQPHFTIKDGTGEDCSASSCPNAFDVTKDGNITAAGTATVSTLNTGQGDYELYNMNQNVHTGANVQFATVNTGQGANELYDMNQNVQTTDTPTFSGMYIPNNDHLIFRNTTGNPGYEMFADGDNRLRINAFTGDTVFLYDDDTSQSNFYTELDMNSQPITAVSTLDTGQGANELYDMDQNVLTTSDVTFADITTSDSIYIGANSQFTGNGRIELMGNGSSPTRDSQISLGLSSSYIMTLGIDDSDGDAFKISDGNALGSGDWFIIEDSTGNTEITSNLSVDENIFIGDADEDHYIYFYEDGSATGESIKWNDASDYFDISDLTKSAGFRSSEDIYTEGAGDDLWLGTATQANALFQANATGNVKAENITGTYIRAAQDLYAYDDLWVTDDIFIGDNLYHISDEDTYIDFNTDDFRVYVGGEKMITMYEGSTDTVTINPENSNIDFIVDGDTNNDIFKVDAGAEEITMNVTVMRYSNGACRIVNSSGIFDEVTCSQ